MSNIKTIKIGSYVIRSDVYLSIKKASEKYNVPFEYMLAIAAKESNFDPNAKSKTSTATGLYQFIKKTWEGMWPNIKIIPSPTDPDSNSDAGARYVKQIQQKLKTNDYALLYLGHFLGPNAASNFIEELNKDPNQLVNVVINENQLKANKSVFYNDNNLKTLQDVYNWSKKSLDNIIKKLK